MRRSKTTSSEERIFEIVRKSVAKAQEFYPRFGNKGPTGTCHVSRMLESANCRVVRFPFETETGALIFPQFDGTHVVMINDNSPRLARQFDQLHELHHAIAGDCDGISMLSDAGYMAMEERAADLFALTDLLPTYFVEGVIRESEHEEIALLELEEAIDSWVEDWPLDRLDDRARMRLRMFHSTGI